MNREEWYIAHHVCPQCGKTNIRQSMSEVSEVDGNFHDGVNTADCVDCSWSGMVKDLKPDPTVVQPSVYKTEVRTIDAGGKTYVCVEDLGTELAQYCKMLVSKLATPDAVNYTQALFRELLKMLINLDNQHMAGRKDFLAKQKLKEKDAGPEAETKN